MAAGGEFDFLIFYVKIKRIYTNFEIENIIDNFFLV